MHMLIFKAFLDIKSKQDLHKSTSLKNPAEHSHAQARLFCIARYEALRGRGVGQSKQEPPEEKEPTGQKRGEATVDIGTDFDESELKEKFPKKKQTPFEP
jgi:hypothetical protein